MRVLVTRAEHQSAGLAEALRARDIEPVIIPAIEIAPLDDYTTLDSAIEDIASFAWVIFTSANGAAVFLKRNGELPPWVQVAAIGRATAKPLEAAGIPVALIPDRAVAESLADALLGRLIRDDRALLIRAEEGRDVLPETLRNAGIDLTIAPAYRTVIPTASIDAVRELFSTSSIDAITFTSSSSVTNLVALLEAANQQLPETARRISIGPITSAVLREHGIPPHAEASDATVEALADACMEDVKP